ncbi:MAG: chromate efflux transporter [Proteobacteria bacterium]|nr:chromate efflux transporter [Pseudomonadota bacterium]
MISLSDLFATFLRIGLLSFGGPAAQIALMHRVLVEERGWLSERDFLQSLSLCMLLPGPEAMQLATYAGWRLRGVAGGLIAGGLFVLPGALVIAALVWTYVAVGDLPLVQAAFLGVKAAVIVIVLQALRGLSSNALKGARDWTIAGLSFAGIFALGLPFPILIALAAIWGALGAAPQAAALVAPAPWRDTLRTVAMWSALWLVPLAALTAFAPPLLAQIGWFYAWLAVISFGGAYALLAYMTQTVVSEFGWIGTAQMIDALGLAETTPGPLILVTQFVAMLAAALQGGMGLSLAAGAVALWAMFAPCFLFIFAAAPHMERIAANPRLAGALAGIKAAVVGVILNLSVWFALNVIFARLAPGPTPFDAAPLPDWTSVNAAAIALVALAAGLGFGLRWPLAAILTVAATGGIALHLAGLV